MADCCHLVSISYCMHPYPVIKASQYFNSGKDLARAKYATKTFGNDLASGSA